MMFRTLAVAALAVPALALAQAQLPTKPPAKKAPAAREGAVATVNGVAIPASRMEALMNQQKARGAPDNEQVRAQVRDELINRELLMQEASKTAVPKSAEVQSQLDIARQEIVISAYVRDWVRKHPPSDAEVQKEYDRVKAQQGDREYRARHILVEDEDLAKSLIVELRKGGKFEELAAKNSKDPGSKDRGGDLDWHAPGDFDKVFSDAMVKLDKGKYTDAPVKTRFGYHIIQLDDVRTGRFPALAEVKPRIQQQLTQAKIEELVRGLRSKAKVE
jgi:peptidyl-prolyl cis-trans isomerase C